MRKIVRNFKLLGRIKPSITIAFVIGALSGVGYNHVTFGQWLSTPSKLEQINVCFTPGCESLIVQQIYISRSSIYVQAFGLTSPSIIQQLIDAHNRGVKVNVILDGSNLSDNEIAIGQLKAAGVKILIDKVPGIAHNKIMIIDGQKVITGSFNFTVAAEKRNAENVLLISDPKLAIIYMNNWLFRAQKSHFLY